MIHLHSGLFSNYATCIEDTDLQIHNKATVTVYSYFFSAIYPAARPLLENMLFPQWGGYFPPLPYPSVRKNFLWQLAGCQQNRQHSLPCQTRTRSAGNGYADAQKNPWSHIIHNVAFWLGLMILQVAKFFIKISISKEKLGTIGGEKNNILNMGSSESLQTPGPSSSSSRYP